MRWTSGSPSASTTVRSSSVSLPTSSSSTCLPSLVERSRTRRGKRRKTASTGIIRTCMTIAWRACDVRVRFCIACERPGTSASAASASTWVRCRTSSPMKCMSWSSRSASTRTVEEPLLCFAFGAASCLGASSCGTSPVSTAASLTASVTSTWSTSDTELTTPASSESARSETIHTSISRPSKVSTSSGVGVQARVSPSSASAARTMYARTDGIWTSSVSVALICTTRRPSAISARSTGASAASLASSTSTSRSRMRPFRRVIRDLGSISSSPLSSIASTAADSASRHSSRTSIASRGRPPLRWRSSSKTSSISCVRAAMPAKPIVALMPFSECAIRKISSTVS